MTAFVAACPPLVFDLFGILRDMFVYSEKELRLISLSFVLDTKASTTFRAALSAPSGLVATSPDRGCPGTWIIFLGKIFPWTSLDLRFTRHVFIIVIIASITLILSKLDWNACLVQHDDDDDACVQRRCDSLSDSWEWWTAYLFVFGWDGECHRVAWGHESLPETIISTTLENSGVARSHPFLVERLRISRKAVGHGMKMSWR